MTVAIGDMLRDFGCPKERNAVVRLARSLHRVGLKRIKSTAYWRAEGTRNIRDARDLLTYARYLPKPN